MNSLIRLLLSFHYDCWLQNNCSNLGTDLFEIWKDIALVINKTYCLKTRYFALHPRKKTRSTYIFFSYGYYTLICKDFDLIGRMVGYQAGRDVLFGCRVRVPASPFFVLLLLLRERWRINPPLARDRPPSGPRAGPRPRPRPPALGPEGSGKAKG